MKEHFIKCDCGDPHHQVILNWDDETPDKGDVWGVYALGFYLGTITKNNDNGK